MALSEYTPEKLQRMLADVITNRFPLADVTLLLRAGADPDGPVTRGLRPLHYAAYENSVEVTADTVFTLCNPFYNRFYNRLFEVNVLDDSCNPSSDRARRVNRLTTGCATGWMNCANDASQAALERPSQDVHDVTSSQQGSCVDSRRCGAFDLMNIQNVSSTRLSNRLSNRLYECLHDTTGCTTGCTPTYQAYTWFLEPLRVHRKRHLDRFSRFVRLTTVVSNQLTHRQTYRDHAASVAIGRIFALCAGDAA